MYSKRTPNCKNFGECFLQIAGAVCCLLAIFVFLTDHVEFLNRFLLALILGLPGVALLCWARFSHKNRMARRALPCVTSAQLTVSVQRISASDSEKLAA